MDRIGLLLKFDPTQHVCLMRNQMEPTCLGLKLDLTQSKTNQAWVFIMFYK